MQLCRAICENLAGHQQFLLKSKLISSFDLLHVPTLDDLGEDALIEKILNIKFGYFGIPQSDDLRDSSQALHGHKSIRRQISSRRFLYPISARGLSALICF